MSKPTIIFVTGIDTDIGKTIATGHLARCFLESGKSVITQKICQTGCTQVSEDIALHRKIMGIDLLEEDKKGLTCPYIFPEPCSPHLSARLHGKTIDPQVITRATESLAEKYEVVLVEGVGGLMVPLLEDFTLADYLEGKNYQHILVSCSRLGSINHTLLALEIMHHRGLKLLGIIYNRFMDSSPAIADDSARIFSKYLRRYNFNDTIVDMPRYSDRESQTIPDFSSFTSIA